MCRKWRWNMKEQLLNKIRTVVENERFKQEAFFLCGAGTGTPNDKLLEACEKYLKLAEEGKKDEAVTKTLIDELEKAAKAERENLGANRANTNVDYIKEILEQKEFFL